MDEVEGFFYPRWILFEEIRPIIKEIVFKTVIQPFSNMNSKNPLRNKNKNYKNNKNLRTLTFQIYLFLCSVL